MDIFNLLEKALDVRAYYQRLIATNVANAETPGYKEKDIDFGTELDKAVRNAGPVEVKEKGMAEGVPSVDGNTVDMEDQVVKMTENTMMFNSLVQTIHKKFSMLQYAINEGRR
ncbi:MAG: hypothetical protein ABSC19_05860 [Syntrophorhabdales bacterium]|jgi:flagellar basal-body rod protein FlgB